jgi:glutathione synthase
MPARSRFAVLMDPLETIKPAKDSTIAMLRAAAQRGCETLAFGQGDLWTRDGRAFAAPRPDRDHRRRQGLVPPGRTGRARTRRPC